MSDQEIRNMQNETPQEDSNWLSLLFKQEPSFEKEVSSKQKEHVALFEKGLSMQIKKTDTIDMALQSMVKVALAAEFGPSFLHQTGSKKMVQTITMGILSDPELRRQAMVIIDRYAK